MKCIKISRYEKIKTKEMIKDVMGNLVPLYRDVLLHSYMQPLDQILNAIDGEFDCENETGTKIVLEIVEMTEEEYNELPEFEGY